MKCLIVGGEPINEPVCQWGPFAMNTQEQIQQALDDLRSGVFVRPDM